MTFGVGDVNVVGLEIATEIHLSLNNIEADRRESQLDRTPTVPQPNLITLIGLS